MMGTEPCAEQICLAMPGVWHVSEGALTDPMYIYINVDNCMYIYINRDLSLGDSGWSTQGVIPTFLT